MTNAFSPKPLTDDQFLEHVSRDLLENDEMPNDFEPTLMYVLHKFSPRAREIFMMVEKENIPVRTVGLSFEVTGQRIHMINKQTIEDMKTKYGDILAMGMTEYIDGVKRQAKAYGEMNTRSSYYKLGYTDGYDDGLAKRKQKYFARSSLNAISIDDLNLSYRTEHFLSLNGITNVSKILEQGDDLMHVPNLGATSLKELLERLIEFDIDVKQYFPKIIRKFKMTFEEDAV